MVVIVEPQSRLVVLDRLVVVAVLQEQVADVRDRGDVARVEIEGRDEIIQRRLAFAATDMGDAAFVQRIGALSIVGRLVVRGGEECKRVSEPAAVECSCAFGV